MITKEQWLLGSVKAQEYNQDGRHFLIEHNMNYRQSSIILARTGAAALKVLEEVFKKEVPELKFCDEIDIKFSNKEAFLKCREEHLTVNEIPNYINHLAWNAREYKKYFGEYPKGFIECPSYNPEDEENKNDDYYIRNHSGCKNCKDGFTSFSASEEALYLNNYNDKTFVNNFSNDITSHYCTIDLGHHSSGAAVFEIGEYYPSHSVGFFFNPLNNQAFKDKVASIFSEKKKKLEEIKENREKMHEERMRKREEEGKNLVKKFFEELITSDLSK